MIRTITKLTSSMGLTLCLGLALTPFGCGGSQEMSMESIHHGSEGPTAPEATVSDLSDCANKARDRLTETSYAFQFDVEVTESGHAGRVKVRDSYPGDRGIESCMARALEAMPVPMSVMGRLSAQAVSPQSRGVMGNLLLAAAGGGVSLAPIFLAAAGVTIVVAVSWHLTEEAIEAARRRRKVEKECKELLVECINNRWQPEWNRGRYGNEKECSACFRHCIRHGKWHDEACPRPN